MVDNFELRVRCAAVAGWWMLLIAAAIFLLQWIVYITLAPAQPTWLLALWGPGATWQEVRTVWFWFLASFKVCLVLVAFLLGWLTLWARQLRKCAGAVAALQL